MLPEINEMNADDGHGHNHGTATELVDSTELALLNGTKSNHTLIKVSRYLFYKTSKYQKCLNLRLFLAAKNRFLKL